MHQPYRGTTLTAENRLLNKHRVVEIKLASLTTGDRLLLARLWLSPALLIVAATGASLAFRPLQPRCIDYPNLYILVATVEVEAAVVRKSPVRCYQVHTISDYTFTEVYEQELQVN